MTDDISEAVRELDLPADGPELQEARDAVRAAHEYLSERGEATSADIVVDIYPEFESSYLFDDETADSWWEEYIAPGLEQLPDVHRSGDEWRYRP